MENINLACYHFFGRDFLFLLRTQAIGKEFYCLSRLGWALSSTVHLSLLSPMEFFPQLFFSHFFEAAFYLRG